MLTVNEKILRKCRNITEDEKLVLRFFYNLSLSEEQKSRVSSMKSVDQYNLFMSAAEKVFKVLQDEKTQGSGK